MKLISCCTKYIWLCHWSLCTYRSYFPALILAYCNNWQCTKLAFYWISILGKFNCQLSSNCYFKEWTITISQGELLNIGFGSKFVKSHKSLSLAQAVASPIVFICFVGWIRLFWNLTDIFLFFDDWKIWISTVYQQIWNTKSL